MGALAAMMAAGTLAFGQGTQTLTMEQAVVIGLENSKALRQSAGRVAYADARAGEAFASALPSIKAVGNYTRLSDVPAFEFDSPLPPPAPRKITLAPSLVNAYSARVTVQHPLFTGFRIDAGREAAEATVEASSQEFVKDRAELVYAIKAAYWGLYRAREFRKLADENVEQIRSHVNDVKNLMEQGLATTNDRLAAEVQLSDAQLRQIDAANNVRLAQIGLNNTLGIPLSTEIVIGTDIAHAPRAFAPLDSLVERGAVSRPDIKALDARVHAGEAGVTAARAGWWPQIYLSGNYTYARPNSRIQPTQDLFKGTWDLGVTVSLDLWNWGTTIHQTDQAQAQLAQLREGRAQVVDAATLEITQTYLTMEQARERITVASGGLARAEENYRVTNRRFKEGLVINSDMLDAQYSLNLAKTTYTQALVDFELAQERLAKALGEDR
jgi:outer membrane protein TolC